MKHLQHEEISPYVETSFLHWTLIVEQDYCNTKHSTLQWTPSYQEELITSRKDSWMAWTIKPGGESYEKLKLPTCTRESNPRKEPSPRIFPLEKIGSNLFVLNGTNLVIALKWQPQLLQLSSLHFKSILFTT